MKERRPRVTVRRGSITGSAVPKFVPRRLGTGH
ncbi:hypothetical protein E2C01_067768 [Portunus trituberculatus]|uniref:Uncharacterized protein n=1 Tax=Portunus trituberculatus TaxID=210409 RepID=A0A5B7HUK1_PORTR|nr:hypothetical protein [Portunus trituberculatus]